MCVCVSGRVRERARVWLCVPACSLGAARSSAPPPTPHTHPPTPTPTLRTHAAVSGAPAPWASLSRGWRFDWPHRTAATRAQVRARPPPPALLSRARVELPPPARPPTHPLPAPTYRPAPLQAPARCACVPPSCSESIGDAPSPRPRLLTTRATSSRVRGGRAGRVGRLGGAALGRDAEARALPTSSTPVHALVPTLRPPPCARAQETLPWWRRVVTTGSWGAPLLTSSSTGGTR